MEHLVLQDIIMDSNKKKSKMSFCYPLRQMVVFVRCASSSIHDEALQILRFLPNLESESERFSFLLDNEIIAHCY